MYSEFTHTLVPVSHQSKLILHGYGSLIMSYFLPIFKTDSGEGFTILFLIRKNEIFITECFSEILTDQKFYMTVSCRCVQMNTKLE